MAGVSAWNSLAASCVIPAIGEVGLDLNRRPLGYEVLWQYEHERTPGNSRNVTERDTNRSRGFRFLSVLSRFTLFWLGLLEECQNSPK